MKTRSASRILGVALVAALVFGEMSCSDHHHGDGGGATGATCPATQTLNYANFGEAFMQKYCLRCHSTSVSGAARKGAPADHNFDVLADIRSLAEHIDEHAGSGPATTNSLMPKDDPRPTLEERRKLSEWLACQAP